MDWATFIIENSQSLFTLGGVFLGSAITFLIGFLNLRNQSIERDKDRQEQRNIAEIQAIERALGGDIDKAMDLVSNLLKVLSQYSNHENKVEIIRVQKAKKTITDDEYKRLVNLQVELMATQSAEISILGSLIAELQYSFSDEISTAFSEFLDALLPYSANLANSNVSKEIPEDVFKKAGNLRRVLREKKISIRDA